MSESWEVLSDSGSEASSVFSHLSQMTTDSRFSNVDSVASVHSIASEHSSQPNEIKSDEQPGAASASSSSAAAAPASSYHPSHGMTSIDESAELTQQSIASASEEGHFIMNYAQITAALAESQNRVRELEAALEEAHERERQAQLQVSSLTHENDRLINFYARSHLRIRHPHGYRGKARPGYIAKRSKGKQSAKLLSKYGKANNRRHRRATPAKVRFRRGRSNHRSTGAQGRKC